MTKKLPNLIIAGVVKGGTTSLFSYLSSHQEVCSSAVKETCYFHTYRYGQPDSRYRQSTNPFIQYQRYFSHCQNQKYIMEATPGYFEGGSTLAKEIKRQLGNDVKVIVILREPINRLISFFKFNKSMLELSKELSFDEYINNCQSLPISEKLKQENNKYWGIDGGFYSNYLEDWFEVFDDSLKVLFFEDFIDDTRITLEYICDWLNIDGSVFDSYDFGIENKTVGYKYKILQNIAIFLNSKSEIFFRANPQVKKNLRDFYYFINGAKRKEEISQNTIDYLQDIYAPYNRRLSEQLLYKGYKNLPEWLTNIPT